MLVNDLDKTWPSLHTHMHAHTTHTPTDTQSIEYDYSYKIRVVISIITNRTLLGHYLIIYQIPVSTFATHIYYHSCNFIYVLFG